MSTTILISYKHRMAFDDHISTSYGGIARTKAVSSLHGPQALPSVLLCSCNQPEPDILGSAAQSSAAVLLARTKIQLDAVFSHARSKLDRLRTAHSACKQLFVSMDHGHKRISSLPSSIVEGFELCSKRVRLKARFCNQVTLAVRQTPEQRRLVHVL